MGDYGPGADDVARDVAQRNAEVGWCAGAVYMLALCLYGVRLGLLTAEGWEGTGIPPLPFVIHFGNSKLINMLALGWLCRSFVESLEPPAVKQSLN